MLDYVLSRYYLNKDILDQLKKELDSDPDAYTLAGFKMKLNEFFPAGSFMGRRLWLTAR